MWNNWVSSTTIPALEQAAIFSQNRQALLAGNIANMDVPGYKTRDISVEDFHTRLREAIDGKASSSSAIVPGQLPSDVRAMEQVRDVSNQVLLHDGSDVSLEEQVSEISKNEAMHNIAIALMNSQFRNLEVAIRESVNV